MKTDSTENSLVGSRTTEKHGDGGNVETENNTDRKQKSILVIDTPTNCKECRLNSHTEYDFDVCWVTQGKGECPLRHPLKEVSSDFYIYDRQYLFDHLNEEIAILKGTKAFEEFMKARETE